MVEILQPRKSKTTSTISDITDKEVYLYANLYNEIVGTIDNFKFNLRIPNDIKKAFWYKDILNVIHLMKVLKCNPREYFVFQIKNYNAKHSKGRQVPTVKMLSSPRLVSLWEEYVFKQASYKKPIVVSKEALIQYSKDKKSQLMKIYNLTELDFFKDLVLVLQLSPDYLQQSEIFQRLYDSGYYKKVYGYDNFV